MYGKVAWRSSHQQQIFYVHMTVHRNKFLYNENNRRANLQIYSGTKVYMFRYPLYIRHWHMLYRFDDSLSAGSGWN
jgi:hypothetical protein